MKSEKVEMYVPTVDSKGAPLPREIQEEWREKTVLVFSTLFGGCIVVEGYGYYINSEGDLVQEDVDVVYSWVSKQELSEGWNEVTKLASKLCMGFRQEAVLVTRTDIGAIFIP